MKKLRRINPIVAKSRGVEKGQRPIMGAEGIGTTYYQVSLDDLKDAAEAENIWLRKSVELQGFNALDFAHGLYGSEVIGDNLYLCVTDGQDIDINGEMVDPEAALQDFPIDTLSPYIQPATPDIINRQITDSEYKMPSFDKWAPGMLEEGYSFLELSKAASKLGSAE